MTDPQTQEYLTRRTLEIAEDELREKIIEETPSLVAETRALTQAIRESVAFERLKFKPAGRTATQDELDAWARSPARLYNDPTFEDWLKAYRAHRPLDGVIYLKSPKDKTAQAYIQGLSYRAAAAQRKDGSLKIVLSRGRQG